MPPERVLETVLYVSDLAAAEAFYRDVLGLAVRSRQEGRHVFFRLGEQMLLLFDPNATEVPPAPGHLQVPPHGARGPGHVCFAATADELARWRVHLVSKGVTIESEVEWPSRDGKSGGRSIYFRDPAGNSLEFAEPRIWGIT